MSARRGTAVGLAVLLVLAASPAVAATTVLRASLDGRQVVPPAATPAMGFAAFTYDDVTRQLAFTIGVIGLEGAEIARHIHGPALPGANAPAILTLPAGSRSGTVGLTPDQGVALLAGSLYLDVHTTAFPDGEIRGQIASATLSAAVLPGSRSVQVGSPATAFATIANTGPSDAIGCSIALASAIPATFMYQTTNPSTNTVTGAPNTPVDIPAFREQTFVVGITPTAPIPPTEVELRFDCANSPPAPTIGGVDTLGLSASAGPVPDVIAIALPAGVLVLDPVSHQGAFSVSAVNVGVPATITVTADTGSAVLPLAISLCRTELTSGGCVSAPAPSVTVPLGATGVGVAVFVTAQGPVAQNPAQNRVFVRFADATGAVRGSTSIAVQADLARTPLAVALDGAQQVPPTPSRANGFGVLTVDDVTGTVEFNIVLFNLEGAETAAHIHGPAPTGATAPAIFSLPLGNRKSGLLTLTPDERAELLAGLWYVEVQTTAFPDGEIRGQIAAALVSAAVLPNSRSVQVGAPAAAFATVINAGLNDATGCSIALGSAIPASLIYQTTDAATNTLTGSANTPVDIPAGGRQSFYFAITPSAPIPPTEVPLVFDCANSPPAPSITGVNTLLLSASATPVPDVIAIALTTSSFPPGVVTLDEAGQGAFVVSATNVGATGTITITADTGAAALPVALTLCPTTPAGCAGPPAPSITLTMAAGGGVGVAVFVSGTGPIRLDPARNRVFVRFTDTTGVTRGSVSVAVH